MDRVASTELFDFELEPAANLHGSVVSCPAHAHGAPAASLVATRLQQEAPDVRNFIQALQDQAYQAWATLNSARTRKLTSGALLHTLAFVLSWRHKHYVRVRSALGADNVAACMQFLRHSFLVVHPGSWTPSPAAASVADGGAAAAATATPTAVPDGVVVDPYFRDQFVLGRSDAEYKRLLEREIPQVFVGTPAMLEALLSAVAGPMKAAAERQRISLPPWRDRAALLSKWVPLNYRDEHFPPGQGSSPSALATAAVSMMNAAAAAGAAAAAAAGPCTARSSTVGSGMRRTGRGSGSSCRRSGSPRSSPCSLPSLPGSLVPGSITVHLAEAKQRPPTERRSKQTIKPERVAPQVVVHGFSAPLPPPAVTPVGIGATGVNLPLEAAPPVGLSLDRGYSSAADAIAAAAMQAVLEEAAWAAAHAAGQQQQQPPAAAAPQEAPCTASSSAAQLEPQQSKQQQHGPLPSQESWLQQLSTQPSQQQQQQQQQHLPVLDHLLQLTQPPELQPPPTLRCVGPVIAQPQVRLQESAASSIRGGSCISLAPLAGNSPSSLLSSMDLDRAPHPSSGLTSPSTRPQQQQQQQGPHQEQQAGAVQECAGTAALAAAAERLQKQCQRADGNAAAGATSAHPMGGVNVSRFRPLDQLLPTMRTVKLAGPRVA